MVSQTKSCKKNEIRIFGSSTSNVVFILLTEIIIVKVIFSTIYNIKTSLKKILLKILLKCNNGRYWNLSF